MRLKKMVPSGKRRFYISIFVTRVGSIVGAEAG